MSLRFRCEDWGRTSVRLLADMSPTSFIFCCEDWDRTSVRLLADMSPNLHFSCEDWDRTSDLRVMSPTSYRCSTSRRKDRLLSLRSQII